ncbi:MULTISPECIES: methyltransferase domain-containing protein [unclassified Mucilaginibacter]|uniref:class I SAM-dependent methyltransferase n=1 Tax=unclassified Mucilaginibacter TaxID=2617802 RepID=UPI002AC9D952|nr:MULTISPECIES: methyltransferase domain-containing protein [unclassified Mucilaginibacter]MEB0260626.1 methyltransferase domain-containing protein [Mucilaginibacter sp. 10I4]MEB0277489.1 methyltransferase domain-containing protein [Mucilaginibacter sp. 10B2]MEB0302727.1 methyltransferase domain-containing protein [Mucilaginibacter sp. 5C4]WPX24881.1 methyltransferase domain-containing protein [Mucilaginibacter sp. 5C4]
MSDYKDYGYHSSAITYNFDYVLQPLLNMLNINKNLCILDLGCGNGFLVNHLITLGYNAYGTDASERGIEIAKQKNTDRFFVQDLSTGKLPIQLQGLSFDTIISTEVIEHLYDPEGFIEFCRQALAKDGEIILSTPYHGYLKNLVLSVFNKWDSHISPLWLGGHIKMWSRATLSKVLTANRFTVTNFKGCGRIPYLWKSMLIKARLN